MDNTEGDRNETPQSVATTLACGLAEDQAGHKKAELDDQAIEATIARYAGGGEIFAAEKANTVGHSPMQPAHSADSDPQGRAVDEWRGRLLIEQAAIASVAQLSQKLLSSETCLHETINSRCRANPFSPPAE